MRTPSVETRVSGSCAAGFADVACSDSASADSADVAEGSPNSGPNSQTRVSGSFAAGSADVARPDSASAGSADTAEGGSHTGFVKFTSLTSVSEGCLDTGPNSQSPGSGSHGGFDSKQYFEISVNDADVHPSDGAFCIERCDPLYVWYESGQLDACICSKSPLPCWSR